MQTVEDKTAVITGAASGIGLGVARELVAQGCNVALVDLNEAGLEAAARELRDAGARVSTHLVDVADREAMLALPDSVAQVHGPAVHVLVNNAGISIEGTFEQQTLDDWDRLLGVNLWGVIHGCKVFWDALMRADEAWIINISSVFGITAPPGQISYCTSKYAVRGLTEVLWEETAHTHIGVTVVHPAGVDTGIVKASKTYSEEERERMERDFAKAGMNPNKAGAQIVEGMLRGDKRVFIAKGSRAIDRIKRLFPVLGNRWIADAIVKQLGMSDRKAKLLQEYRERRSALGF